MADADILVANISPNPRNPRGKINEAELTGLARTMALRDAAGKPVLIDPIVVFAHPSGRPEYYMLLDGERRWRAALIAKVRKLPATLVDEPADYGAELVDMLITDVTKKALNPIARAVALQRALDNTPGMTQEKLAVRLGIGAGTISHHLRLLDLAEDTQRAVAEGRISVGEAHEAVKDTRWQQRSTGRHGSQGRPRTRLDPPHLARGHELAATAASLCLGNHPARPKVGKVACGQCWEQAIRRDHEQFLEEQGRLLPRPLSTPVDDAVDGAA